MKTRSRLIMGAGSLLLIALYFIPFWTIDMSAPQYPEGIGMYIGINDIQGHNKHDLKSINSLNHYIGMKEIHKEDFIEFKIMPWVFAVLIGLGLVAAATGSVKLVWGWIGLMVIIGIVGFVDFYMWGYDYGHNLNPDAAIKIPGMSYQPPLFGCKQLLNINACSLPTIGSVFLGLSFLAAGWVLWVEKLKPSESL